MEAVDKLPQLAQDQAIIEQKEHELQEIVMYKEEELRRLKSAYAQKKEEFSYEHKTNMEQRVEVHNIQGCNERDAVAAPTNDKRRGIKNNARFRPLYFNDVQCFACSQYQELYNKVLKQLTQVDILH